MYVHYGSGHVKGEPKTYAVYTDMRSVTVKCIDVESVDVHCTRY